MKGGNNVKNTKTIKVLLIALFVLTIIFLYRFISPNIEVNFLNGTDIAICSSIGIFILSLIITVIRTYR